MEFFQEIGLFLAEAVILVTAIIVVIIAIAAASQRRKGGEEGYIEVRRLNDRYTAFHDAVRSFTEHAETRKVREKAEKKSAKAEQNRHGSRLKRRPVTGTASRAMVDSLYFDFRAISAQVKPKV